MIATDRGLKMGRFLVAAAAFGAVVVPSALRAQAPQPTRGQKRTTAPAATKPVEPPTRLPQNDTPHFEETAVPVNPSDPIAIVNKEVITRQQLADECVARKGKEILDTLIARRLIEQAMRSRKIDVTGSEIDQEIEETAQRMAGVNRETWLRTLDKERGISPVQYARDIIYPSIALRKLASPRVQVTPQDLKDAMEANFGEKLQCRIIMTTSQRSAVDLWEALKKNPGGFEKMARESSRDTSTAAMGGLLPEPIARHAHPRAVSDSAFEQLVDGDRKDNDPSHKPKDGEISGPIQVNDMAWVIVKREGLIPAKPYDKNDPTLRAMFHKQMFDVKLQEAMTELMNDLLKGSAVDNRLTGRVKDANEEEHPDFIGAKDTKVKLMGAEVQTPTSRPGRAASGNAAAPATTSDDVAAPVRPNSAPPGVSPEVVNQAESIKKSFSQPK
jgi:parvulin-like peptidyl-prolyl isomerase